jgi:hypothetical protein
MLRKVNIKALVIQCVGYVMVFYVVSEHSDGIINMAEFLTIGSPKEIAEIDGLLRKVYYLKR